MNALFIYRKEDRYRVLGLHPAMREAQTEISKAEELLATGWKLTASINSPLWLEHFLNADADEQAASISRLTNF